ncbi:uncharacterized protein N7459_002291 [Penicillium hispanicum]|uniref:uncharacterized protein n=1 Tax=Penicillium hispanicum TaxID=1080232 RepID=UPI0025422DB5|nr:uncharacterized protein N7459_002291 [Penicillium hispanicum]KAJ5591922.1 hypothetical protein N7459_002291 [Penicillium hispanicum]
MDSSRLVEAAEMSLRDMRLVFRRDGFDEDFVKGAMIELLRALDFLHIHGEVVHTGTACSSILFITSKKNYQLPRLMRPNEGPILLSDFGEARIGPGPHGGDITPLEYRTPETLHYVGWSDPVDIWSVGLTPCPSQANAISVQAWDLLEPKRLFTARDEDGDLYDAAHLAQHIAALGPPPPGFLARNPERKADFWDELVQFMRRKTSSKLLLSLSILIIDRTMEALETRLEDNTGFLRFIRRALTWLPKEGATAKQLLQDPWLTGERTCS